MIRATDHLLIDGTSFAWHHSDMEQSDITSPSLRQRWKQMGRTQEKRETTFIRTTGSSLSKTSG